MPPKIHPRKKQTARLKTPATYIVQQGGAVVTPRYERVLRGTTWSTGQGRVIERERRKVQRALQSQTSTVERLQSNQTIPIYTKRIAESKIIHIQNRLQTLESIKTRFIREGVYEYQHPTPQQDFIYVEYD